MCAFTPWTPHVVHNAGLKIGGCFAEEFKRGEDRTIKPRKYLTFSPILRRE
jgi:hypothetical protein